MLQVGFYSRRGEGCVGVMRSAVSQLLRAQAGLRVDASASVVQKLKRSSLTVFIPEGAGM